MKVTLAKVMGTCFGVQDAIDEAMDPVFKDNLTIIGQLVHNPQTLEQLRQHGIRIVNSIDEPIATKNVMITAHGAPASMIERARKSGYNVFDASCPLVLRVHKTVAKLVAGGFHPVVIGESQHVEVRGIVGDLDDFTVIGTEEDVVKIAHREKVGIVCQTTQQIEVAQQLVKAIHQRYPNIVVKFVDTICKPTKARQEAVKELAEQVDVMIVVGGHNSSNTKKLKKACEARGLEVHHIERAADLQREWFRGKTHAGITAGTSTPEYVTREVYDAIQKI